MEIRPENSISPDPSAVPAGPREERVLAWLASLRTDAPESLASLQEALGGDPAGTVRALYAVLKDRRAELAGLLARHADRVLPKAPTRPVRTVAFYCPTLARSGGARVAADVASRLADAERDGKPMYRVILITCGNGGMREFPVSPRVIRREIPFPGPTEKSFAPHAEALSELLGEYSVDAFVNEKWFALDRLWDLLLLRLHPSLPACFEHAQNFGGSLLRMGFIDVREPLDTVSLADGIVALSEADRAFFSALCPLVRIVPNPCCLAGHAKGERSPGPGNVLWLAKFRPDKRPAEIVRIMERVAREIPGVRCRVVGGGEADRSAESLRALAEERGLGGVITVEGFVDDVAPCYEWADVFVSTSSHESFLLTLYEAAACGVPSVSYELPWLSYYSDLEGWDAVPQGDAEAAADRIVSVLKDRAAWEKRSRALYESFQRFAAHDVTEDWIALFRDFESGAVPPARPADPATARTLILETARLNSEGCLAMRGRMDRFAASAAEAKKALSAAERERSRLAAQLENECARNAALTSSLSFRLGRALTWLPRKMRDLLQKP